MNPKPATDATRAVLARAAGLLENDDRQDFEDAARGLIAPLPDGGSILDDAGGKVWDVEQYQWVNEGDCPDSVHPSLRRQTQLLTLHGLFEVCEGIYQVRSADLANMTIIEGDTGIVLVDPLTAPPTARARSSSTSNTAASVRCTPSSTPTATSTTTAASAASPTTTPWRRGARASSLRWASPRRRCPRTCSRATPWVAGPATCTARCCRRAPRARCRRRSVWASRSPRPASWCRPTRSPTTSRR